MKHYSLKKYERLSKEKDFKNVLYQNKKIFSKYLNIYFCYSNLKFSRLGVSIKKKFGTAVERNRAKRHIREIFRLNKHKFIQKIDIVFIIKNEFKPLDYHSREKIIIDLLKKANLIKE